MITVKSVTIIDHLYVKWNDRMERECSQLQVAPKKNKLDHFQHIFQFSSWHQGNDLACQQIK